MPPSPVTSMVNAVRGIGITYLKMVLNLEWLPVLVQKSHGYVELSH